MTDSGPVGAALAGLRRAGAGERVLKTALAVGLAWELGSRIPGVGSPYLAPLAALLSMQITVADSLSAASQRVLGIVVGVTVAIAVSAFVGINGLTVGVLVLAAFATGAALRLGPQGIQQVAISALLLVAVGSVSSFHYAIARIVETVVGAAVGVTVNALLAPPSHIAAARLSVAAHATALADALGNLGSALAAGITPTSAVATLDRARATDAPLRAAQAAVERSQTSLKYNLWSRGERSEVRRLAQCLRAQERVAMQARGIVRTIEDATTSAAPSRPGWLEPAAFGGNLPSAIDGVCGLVRSFPVVMLAPAGSTAASDFALKAAGVAELRARLATDPEVAKIASDSQDWVPLGSVLADLDRIRRELAGAVADRDRPTLPPPFAPTDVPLAQ